MGFSSALYSSTRHDWCTPVALFDALDAEFGPFGLDAAASTDNALCEQFLTVADDALSVSWHQLAERVWLNPPYGRKVGHWVKKAAVESAHGCRVVVLTMARVDTQWWQMWATKAAQIIFIKGRVHFEQAGVSLGASPAPSAVLVFDELLRQPTVMHRQLPRR